MKFTFYILYSSSLDNFYIGHTGSEIQERFGKHLSDHKGFTGKAKDWEIVYCENYGGKSEAYKRELQVKSWKSAKKIRAFILEVNSGSVHPDL